MKITPEPACCLFRLASYSLPHVHPNINSSVNNTDSITHSVVLNGQYDVAVDIVALSFRVGY